MGIQVNRFIQPWLEPDYQTSPLDLDGNWVYAVPKSFVFEDVNDWWVSTISTKWGWTDIEVIDERDLTIAGHDAKVVTFEFTSRNRRHVDMTYHICRPTGKYNLYRIRMTYLEAKCEELLKVYEDFVIPSHFYDSILNIVRLGKKERFYVNS